MPKSKTPPRAWQRMLSGRRLDLLDPSPLDIEIGDIAHGLARVARWNGQTYGAHAFSVAQHCVLVERVVAELSPRVARAARLTALLHDAPEYVVGDLISPFKAAVGIDYKDFELRLLAAIHVRFGLPARASAEILALVNKADTIAAYHEATQ
ncbi:MAG TPA: HD family hydrolase, partial [Rhizomicrobium sp.]|nr:HD family hydrolase [Rhizomicrobium sp.]